MRIAWIGGAVALVLGSGLWTRGQTDPAAPAAVSVEVVDLAPSAEATLAAGEAFYLRLRFSAGQPVRIWARPAWRGEQVREIFSHASPLHLGAGETLGWFSVSRSGLRVDAVQVTAVGAQSGETVWSGSVPVALTIGEQGPAKHPEPSWVATLRAADQAAMERDRRMASSQPSSVGETVMVTGMIGAGLLGLLLGTFWPLWALWRWRGLWRLAPLAPLAALAFVVLRIVVDTARDPTSHNLWPFEIAMVAWPAVAYMLIVAIARFVVRRTVGAGPTVTQT